MQQNIPLLNNSYIISLIGKYEHIIQARNEIEYIAKSWGLTCESVNITPKCLDLNMNITPKCLDLNMNNQLYDWRVKLKNLITNSNSHIIINMMDVVTPDDIIDFNRSVRAFRSFGFINRHPWTFIVDLDVDNKNKSELFKYYENSGQVNMYARSDTIEIKKQHLEFFIKPMELS